MNKRLLNTASAAPFMGFYGDGGTTVLMPHMRNRMTFAPEDGTGNAGSEDNTQSGQERMRQAMLAEEAKRKLPKKLLLPLKPVKLARKHRQMTTLPRGSEASAGSHEVEDQGARSRRTSASI